MVKARNSLFEAGKEGGEYREKGFCLTQTRKEIIMCEVKSLDFIKKASDKVEKEKQKADGKAAWKKGMERARKRDKFLRNQKNVKIAAFKEKKLNLSLN